MIVFTLLFANHVYGVIKLHEHYQLLKILIFILLLYIITSPLYHILIFFVCNVFMKKRKSHFFKSFISGSILHQKSQIVGYARPSPTPHPSYFFLIWDLSNLFTTICNYTLKVIQNIVFRLCFFSDCRKKYAHR